MNKKTEEATSLADRRARGVAVLADQHGVSEDAVVGQLTNQFGKEWADEVFVAVGGDAWADDCLSLRDRSLIVLAALAAQGGVETRLGNHIRWALRHGVTQDELESMARLLNVYIGYPKSSLALEIIRDVINAD